MNVTRRYTFKLYPTPEQAALLHDQRMMCADLWNALLQRNEDMCARTRGRQRGVVHAPGKALLSFFDMTNEITQLRHECPEWESLSVWVGHRIAKALELAFKAFFRRARSGAGAQSGYPRFKRRKDNQRIPHRCVSGCKLSHRGGRNWSLYLKGVSGSIHARGQLPADASAWTDADVIWRDGAWWFSCCIEIDRQRFAGIAPTTVRLAPIDGLAEVNGHVETPNELSRAAALERDLDHIKSERDLRWPRRLPQDPEWIEENARIARLSARIARIRSNALHVWSARLVARSSDLTIIKPALREHIKSAHGDEAAWGANVAAVSELNRGILSRAPAAAAAMIEYKAAEAGIRCDVVTDEAPEIAVGAKLVAAGKKVRKLKRAIRRNYGDHQQRIGSARRRDRGSERTSRRSAGA